MRSENRELDSFAALRRGRNQRLATKRASTSPSNGAARRCPPVSGNPLPAKSVGTGRQQRPACGRLHRPGLVRPPQHQTSCPAPQLTHRHPRHFPHISPTIISRDRQWEPLESPRFIDPEHPLVEDPRGRILKSIDRSKIFGSPPRSGRQSRVRFNFSRVRFQVIRTGHMNFQSGHRGADKSGENSESASRAKKIYRSKKIRC